MKVLLVDPNADIWAHYRVTLQIALALLRGGHSVTLISCNRSLVGHCTVDESHKFELGSATAGLPRSCNGCSATASDSMGFLNKYRNFRSLEVPQILSTVGRDVNFIGSRLQSAIDHVEPQSGCPVGVLALYDTFLRFKLTSLDEMTSEAERFHRTYALNAFRMAQAAARLAKDEKFDAVIAYSPQYSSVGAFCWPFERRDTPVFFVEGSSGISQKYSHFRLWNWTSYGLDGDKKSRFTYDLQKTGICRLTREHFRLIEVGASYSVYSPKPSRGIGAAERQSSPGSHVALLSMSSSDEVLAARVIGRMNEDRISTAVFADQVEWLSSTIAWFAKHPDLKLVVRPHPRDFPTGREPAEAQHTSRLRKVLQNLPDNVEVDWPSNPKPLWDYFGSVRLLITGWSSTAMEAIYNDTQVLCYDEKLVSFPKEIVLASSSQTEYFDELENAMLGSIPVSEFQKSVLSQWVEFNFFGSDVAGVPRILEGHRKRIRILDKLLNGFDYYFPKLYRKVDLRRISRQVATLAAAERQIVERLGF